MTGDENTAKTGGGALTPEDAVAMDRAIASRPASPPRGYMVQGEVRELEPEESRGTRAPGIVCLCGSTRFEEEWKTAHREESLAGRIVLSVGVMIQAGDSPIRHDGPDKRALDELHLRKIDLADEVLVINPGGYIGDSTRREVAYALAHGKPIRYTETEARIRELEEDGGHQKARIRELEDWKRSRVDPEVEARKLSQQVDELEGEVLELEGRLERVRPVVRDLYDFYGELTRFDVRASTAERWLKLLDALTPSDRAWAEGDS